MAPPDVPLCRPIRHGTTGPDAVGAKRALSRAGYMRWGHFTPVWGDFAVEAAKKFQADHGIEQTGNYGKATHAALVNAHRKGREDEWAWDSYGVTLVKAFCERMDEEPEDRVRAAIVSAARYWNRKRNEIHYRQVRPFAMPDPPDIPREIDCSGFVTICHKAAGAKNPNAQRGQQLAWNGQGYTGTLMGGGTRCTKVSKLKPGDCVFYGSTRNPSPAFPVGSPTHVALYVGGGMVITHGNEDGPELVPYNYWSAINCYMTYGVV